MCQRYFAVRDIEDHAADCDGINIPEEPQTNAEAKYRQTQPGVEDEYRQTQPSMEGKFRQTQIKQPGTPANIKKSLLCFCLNG